MVTRRSPVRGLVGRCLPLAIVPLLLAPSPSSAAAEPGATLEQTGTRCTASIASTSGAAGGPETVARAATYRSICQDLAVEISSRRQAIRKYNRILRNPSLSASARTRVEGLRRTQVRKLRKALEKFRQLHCG